MDEHSSIYEAACKAFDEAVARAEHMEEFREKVHAIHSKLDRQRRGRSFRTLVGSLLGGIVLSCSAAIGVSYGLNERSYVLDDGTRIESSMVGLVDHTRFEIRTDGSRTITHYTPLERTTSRAYTDTDGDGQVDQVWRSLEHAGSPLEFRGRIYSRGDTVFNENYIDGIFQEGLESFGEPLTLEPDLP